MPPLSALMSANHGTTAVLTLDLPGEPVNKLTARVKREFEEALKGLQDDPSVKAVVIISGKPDVFIAGADIEEFTRLSTREEFERLAREGQEMLQRLDDFPKPVVVAIHGSCVGGGLELALAADWRIATDHPKTQLGLPEVQLGLLPAAGGCQRLPRLIGLTAALGIILPGRSEPALKALKLGLVDEVVPRSILLATALAAADRLVASGFPHRRPRGGLGRALLERNPLGRRFVYWKARKDTLRQTRGNYPAPLAALEAVRTGLERGARRGFVVEHRKFGELATTEVSKNLVGIFFATNALKKDDGVPPGTIAHAQPVEHLAVIGSGFMGAGIAGTAVATAGIPVRLKDTEFPRVGKGLKSATDILAGRLKRRRITRYEFARESALLSGGTDFAGFARAGLVIEAVFEDLAIKRKVLAETEAATPPSTIFATNTSTIPIADIAAEALRPQQILGMHFFSPVDRMPLLEVIPTDRTAPDSVATAVQFGKKLGKTVIVVRDRPGFWVNRILTPYLNEAGYVFEEGVPMDVIDRIMTRFGFPVGPITLLDEVGLDVAAKACKVMYGAFGDRLKPSDLIGKLLADQRMGRKNGKGFYLYHKGQKTGPDESAYDLLGLRPRAPASTETIERRLVYSLLNEAAMAAGEGVVRSPRDGDLGAIFGIGYPPFRGGPLRYLDHLGAGRVVEALRDLERSFGQRFRPAESLVAMAERGERFYPA
ncbi:MAG TPA: fatty acid oxidation complex subunit alpha FadJ [Gemmatimonadales bacterium]|nr:fatty acid oxidation complex subunit alpha FadJ [Gemmatimonadales bacterium]